VVAKSPNRILAALSGKALASLLPHLKVVELKLGDVIAQTGSRVHKVYFPHSGVISLVVELNVGNMVETAMIGCDGLVNGSSALDGKVSLNKIIVQLAGIASVIDIGRFRAMLKKSKGFSELIVRHEQVLFAQSQQSAACNAKHTVEKRMCRWLLRLRDLADGDNLTLTQEFLAQMLGVRRASVSGVAKTLQRGGLIKYSRGHIRLVDVAGLRKGSCECYGTVERHYARLFESVPRSRSDVTHNQRVR
jgi:CRP-like cAMP-binding protein